MATIGFIGLGNMGGPMVRNLINAGHTLKVFDLSEEAMNYAVQSGAKAAESIKDAAAGVEVVITMLPVGADVREVYLNDGVVGAADKGALLIDCSTIDVESARAACEAARAAGLLMVDAPVSGGTVGAEAATLTFMCGGEKSAFDRARPILQGMGRNIVHCGGPGQGQVVKICNNMLAGINSLAVSEAFVLGEKLGVDRKVLYDVISTSTGNSHILQNSCPMPNTVPTAASSNGFKPGFKAKLMLKDMRLSQAAAQMAGSSTPLGAAATAVYAMLIENGLGEEDVSAVIKMIKPDVK